MLRSIVNLNKVNNGLHNGKLCTPIYGNIKAKNGSVLILKRHNNFNIILNNKMLVIFVNKNKIVYNNYI